jgi:signal transduction histidine kinase
MHTELEHPSVSRHKCLIYDGHPSEQLPVVVPLLKDGLENNWRCLYLGEPEIVRMVDTALAANGFDTRREIHRGALVFSSDRSHLAGGKFDPAAMIDGLCELIDGAVKEGFEGLCATGDMRWELGDDRNFERLVEYEARLEQVFRDKPLRGICQYHRDVLPPQAVRDALLTHRSAYVGDTLNRDNLFYIPPELLLEEVDGSDRTKQGEWMCQQIIRVLDAEQKRDQAFRALAEVNRDLERRVADRTAELEAANKELEAFSYSVSHDLRAPVRAIDGFSAALLADHAGQLDEQGREYLTRVRHATNRMALLIDDLLGLSKITRAELRRQHVDLSEVARRVLAELGSRDPARNVTTHVADGMVVDADPRLITVMLENLLGNAWKYTSKQPAATIAVGREARNGETAYFVRDNGAGFSMEHATRLFAPFQRLHAAAEFEGTGIGLATVARIVGKHGGRVWAEAKLGEGATFLFTLGA